MAARIAVWATLVAAAMAPMAFAEEPASASKQGRYVRLVRDDAKRPTSLQVAIVRMVPRDCGLNSPIVDLVGAVHIADTRYYEQLNREFAKYDAVLYELVAREGTKVQPGRRSSSPVSRLQVALKEWLDLSFQLDVVRYDRPNMVHADMSPEALDAAMSKPEQGWMAMIVRSLGRALAEQNRSDRSTGELELLMALVDKQRSMALKRALAGQMEQLEEALAAIAGPDGSPLIDERNKVALAVLKKQLAAGKNKVAIFYGAGHLADFQKRLEDDFDLTVESTRWLSAWDLSDKAKK